MYFVLIDHLVKDRANVQLDVFAEDQLGWIGGAAAGLVSKSKVVGILSSLEIPPVLR